jgi:cephalosporin hydroxylase
MSEAEAERDLPPAVSIDLAQPLRSYWLDRARQHMWDSYAGVPISKFPEDLRVYEHLLWASRADAVIEIGAQFGGSALWFRDRLRTFSQYRPMQAPRVISIDIDIGHARANIAAADPEHEATITLIEGDVRDPAVARRAIAAVPDGSRCFVVEDSAHVYETTWAALTQFSAVVPLGGYFVVEDGCVDVNEMRLSDDWPRGVLPAIRNWLGTAQGSRFSVRRDLERYGLSCHPGGFLQRTAADDG